MNFNTYAVHSQLSAAVRASAAIRAELGSRQGSVVRRLFGRMKYAWLQTNINALTLQLRGRY